MQRCKNIRNFFQKRGRNNEDGDDVDVTPVTICIDWDFLLNLYTFYLYLYRSFYLLETFLHFHNTHLYCICYLKNEGRKKAKKKKKNLEKFCEDLFSWIYHFQNFREDLFSQIDGYWIFRENLISRIWAKFAKIANICPREINPIKV